MNFTIDGIRPTYEFDGSCKGTVPQAVVAGSIAEPFFGIPRDIGDEALSYLDIKLLKLFCEFEKTFILPKKIK